MEMAGKTIGRFEIAQMIGEGGMAQVYRAYDPQINRSVALKILKDEHCADEEHTSRFIKEGKAAGALTHPNIVTIYDVGNVDDVPYIMMELLEGENLGDIMRKGQRIPQEVVIDLAIQIASALDYAHKKGVIHRDLKPDNIMMGADGASAKIADFGIARVEETGSAESTQVGMMLGTPRYMSPEQACGTTIDSRSDLFTLGVILYEMITGQKAFDAETIPTLIMQIVQKDPVPIRQINSHAPVGLQKIVAKLLQKKPEKRFQSGAELMAALERERLAAQDDAHEKRGYLPLQVKWTAIMGAIVALTMAISSVLVFRAQSDALTQQAIDSGISLARFTAVQAAIPVLSEDWITLESFVDDASKRRTFRYLVVSDHQGIIRSATDHSQIGQSWLKDSSATKLYQQEDVVVTALDSDQGEIFNFNLPVLFGDTVVGEINLGVETTALDAALATTQRMMFILAFAIVLAVSVVIYIFNKLIAKNVLLATQALKIFGRGQLETRISKTRTDEFGDLFNAFNDMADALESQTDYDPDKAQQTEGASSGDHHDLDVSGIIQGIVEEQTIVRSADDDDSNT